MPCAALLLAAFARGLNHDYFLGHSCGGLGHLRQPRGIYFIIRQPQIPHTLQSALQYVAPATLSALIVTVLVDDNGQFAVGLAEMTGLGLGALVAYFTRNHLYTLVVAMGSFLTLNALL